MLRGEKLAREIAIVCRESIVKESGTWNSAQGISKLGISAGRVRYNAGESELIEAALRNKEAMLSRDGAVAVETGKFTGRSPKDKYIVREPSTEREIWWGGNNALSPGQFEVLKGDIFSFLSGKELDVQDLECSADPLHRVNVRLIAQYSWHALFLRHLLRRPSRDELKTYIPEFTIVNAPGFHADPEKHGTNSETVIALSFDQKLVLIAGTEYAGENKKSAFTILNHIFPDRGILPMHCSANHAPGDESDTAIFFGLSGTGKTTLSTEPSRVLIGDDEHGWSNDGVFNFEGGCYAKTINLSREAEPEIWKATHAFGTVLENVVLDPESRSLVLDDASLTENTRAAYPLTYMANTSRRATGGTPRNVFLLTCDAFGVTPPICRLTPAQAETIFLLGFTSKVAGTERGVTSPTPTFSTCFAAPFITRHPEVYGAMFAERLQASGANVWLLNTGWTGGDASTGKRMPISITRALLQAALAGELDAVSHRTDPVWELEVPATGPDEAIAYLDPKETWRDKAGFDAAAGTLRAILSNQIKRLGIRNNLPAFRQTQLAG
ncbi:phosphoenolpyruvate carboxykinase (ATP) [Roseibium sp. M-1]